MKRYLAIVEKPDLARSIQACYRNHRKEIESKIGKIDFVMLIGHACTWLEPNDYEEWNGYWDSIEYPMIPASWRIKAIQDKTKKRILADIRTRIKNNSYDGLINCCDSDTEGSGIFWLIIHYLGLSSQPALRFMEHSLTDKEILESLLTMKSNDAPEHVRSCLSFLLRSQVDWLYGMNMTRLMTVKMGELMTIGRVKAPTIQMVYDNSMAIKNFRPEKYIHMQADYGSFQALLVNSKGIPQRFQKPITDIPTSGTVVSKEVKLEYTHAPRLYDLSAIQSEAGKTFGFTLIYTLSLIQSLYEEHKLISYPRTQCRYVSTEKAKEFPNMLQSVSIFPDLAYYVEKIKAEDLARVLKDPKVVNDEEIAKEAHDALLPTDQIPDASIISKLSEDELKILRMIYIRLLSQFLPQLEEEKTKILIKHGNYNFGVHGKMIVNQGWRVLYGALDDKELPYLNENDVICANKIQAIVKETKPPKRLTEATLLDAMKHIGNQIKEKNLKQTMIESQGIGTPATQGKIIQDIIDRGYVSKQKGLTITEKGIRYVEGLKDVEIVSPVFAAKMDLRIKMIQRGEADYKTEYDAMVKALKETCQGLAQKSITHSIECPICGGILNIQKYSYLCHNCGIKIPRTLCGVAITEEMLYDSKKLSRKRTFQKKNGDKFHAGLELTENGLEFI